MASSNRPVAAMSSRLATMKFMQRAAATPKASPDTTPDRSAKRQRLSNESYEASPVPASGSDAEAIQQVLAKEDRKRQEAIDREAARRGETKWILDIMKPQQSKPPLMRVVSTGYADLDSSAVDHLDQEDDLATPQNGRRRFGTLPVQIAKPDPDDSDDHESAEESDDDAEDHKPEHSRQDSAVARQLGDALRAKRDAKRKKERSKGLQQAADRRTKKSNLNQLTSISNGGRSRAPTTATCHRCGKPGHIKTNCPLKKK